MQGEQEHRRVKKYYARTNKNRGFEMQIAMHETRIRRLREIGVKLETSNAQAASEDPMIALPREGERFAELSWTGQKRKRQSAKETFRIDPSLRYYMSHNTETRYLHNLVTWLESHAKDPAFEVSTEHSYSISHV